MVCYSVSVASVSEMTTKDTELLACVPYLGTVCHGIVRSSHFVLSSAGGISREENT